MKPSQTFLYAVVAAVVLYGIFGSSGCANIVPPSGGPRDSLPPLPVSALPKDSALNVNSQKISINFNEFVELKSAYEKVLISPYPGKLPEIESKLRTVTIRLKDSLLPNTTYTIDFGDAIADLNEGNVLRDFHYTFSTGNAIDSNELRGKVVLAETGKTDSTMLALLYTKQEDSTVAKEKPKYISRVDANGNFIFRNLPPGKFYVYALLDTDGDKKYSQPVESFAFLDQPVMVNDSAKPVMLYAFAAEKEKKKESPAPPATTKTIKGETLKSLTHGSNLEAGSQDLLDSLKLTYLKPLKKINTDSIRLLIDSATLVTDVKITNDTVAKKMVIYTPWKKGANYTLLLNSGYAEDTSGLKAIKNDTLKFRVKDEKEYGSIRIKFTNLDTSLHPVLLFYSGDQLVKTYPLTSTIFIQKLFKPGTYQLGVLFDANNNGRWDTGDYFAKPKRQPETVQQIGQTLTVKENWDNELNVDISKPASKKETTTETNRF
jgi:uncharacterized protein (DUF2141 family)